MIDTEHFVKRLETIFDYYGLTASLFAEKINVQRSSISHLLSGRNKPSLDFILKVIENFPEVELLWLLNGKGSFPTSENGFVEKTAISYIENSNQVNDLFSQETVAIEKRIEKSAITQKIQNDVTPKAIDSKIECIVIFYADGTFKNYLP
ncbi:helix-turn-helix domain-containing protein [Flavobacterium sp.]|jgi:transcriptional regulator with XRE-family HTH domain|uniref:helix-turn-helix domain-containing protein n=1 Tax=Flavobacterium sp. TaxID=239 RepID=UPI0037BE3356